MNDGATQSEFGSFDVQRFPTGKSVVRVSGELIRDTPAQLTRIVEEELMRAPSPLVLDLSAVTHINATGVKSAQVFLTGDDVQRSPLLRSGLGQDEGRLLRPVPHERRNI